MASIFLDHWIVSLDIPAYFLTDSGLQIVSKFPTLVCGYLSVKHLTTTAYHPQTNGQSEQFDRAIVIHPWHNVVEHQED